MTEAEIQDKVIAIVAEQMGVDKSKIKRESSFTNDLNADSLDIVELVMEVEDQFGISIPDDQCHRIQTVGSAIYYIKANLKAYEAQREADAAQHRAYAAKRKADEEAKHAAQQGADEAKRTAKEAQWRAYVAKKSSAAPNIRMAAQQGADKAKNFADELQRRADAAKRKVYEAQCRARDDAQREVYEAQCRADAEANFGAGPNKDYAAKSAKQYIDIRTGKILSSNEIKELLKSGSMESFIISGVIGYATDSALLGGIVGGDLLGGIIGDVLNSSDDDSSGFIDDLLD